MQLLRASRYTLTDVAPKTAQERRAHSDDVALSRQGRSFPKTLAWASLSLLRAPLVTLDGKTCAFTLVVNRNSARPLRVGSASGGGEGGRKEAAEVPSLPLATILLAPWLLARRQILAAAASVPDQCLGERRRLLGGQVPACHSSQFLPTFGSADGHDGNERS